MNYDPNRLYPGGTEARPQHVMRPSQTYTSGPVLDTIEQRWRSLQVNGVSYDPALTDFLQSDVSRLMTIARAAYRMVTASNAELHRQAAEQLHQSLR